MSSQQQQQADADKVKMLMQRDRDMSRYMEEEHVQREAEARAAIDASRGVIVALLQHISEEIGRQAVIPSCVRALSRACPRL